MTLALPLFVNRYNKIIAGAVMYGISYFCYYLTNHNVIFDPVTLPHTWVDSHTPFIPYTVLIYISEYFYFAAVYLTLRDYDNINRYLYSFFLLQVVSCAFFLAYPTIYPRDAFAPTVQALEPQWLRSIWLWLWKQDAPTNCLPSLHVSSVYLSALVFRTDGPNGRTAAFRFYFTWSTLIALTTLTTKQHYLVDIVSGFGLALLFYWWFHRKQRYFYISEAAATKQV
ncbi:MAG: phosphatase PAP2 family protein [Bdellovibrionales bacterium]|nr:phosphatase PAP2 family protein [Bdellovibrionales bacterium]